MCLDWLFIGLGNPGARYRGTWHNAGFEVLDLLLQQMPELAWQEKPKLHLAVLRNPKVLFVKPQLYMNLSGKVLPFLHKRYEFCPERTIVLLDNLDLQPGRLKLKFGGGSSSHNGLRSLAEHGLKGNFWRLFIGIGHPGDPNLVSNYVLSKPRGAAQEPHEQGLQRATWGLSQILCGVPPEQLVAELNRRA